MKFIYLTQENVNGLLNNFYEEDKEKGTKESNLIFLISIFTSWVSPCTVWYNGFYYYMCYFLMVLSSITLAIHLLGNCFLFGFINIHGIVNSSAPPIFHCFVNGTSYENTTVYQFFSPNDSLIQICNDCFPAIRLCDDDEKPSYSFNTFVGPLAITLLICSFASAVVLQFLADNEIMKEWSYILCCLCTITWSSEFSEGGHCRYTNNTPKIVWKEQPILKYIQEKRLGMVCLLHLFGASCEIFDASKNSALTVLSQRIEDAEIVFEHFNAFIKWYCINILGLYQNAVCHEYFKCAKLLLNCNADINSVIDENGSTILHIVATNGYLEEVKIFLEAKANVNSKNVKFETPIILAAREAHFETVQQLIKKGANINDKDEDGITPLHLAAWKGHFEIVQLLIEKGANINDKDKDAWTPLHLAAENGHFGILQLLIQNGANINDKIEYQWKYGRTQIAAREGHFETVQQLIKKGANINDKDEDGITPLHLCH